jgi:dipeptidyl aminopeptidase/acylaminoacyl peptidase
VYSGLEKKRIMWSPFPQGRFYTDKNGTVRLVTGRTEDNSIRIQGLPDGAQDWVDIGATNHGRYFTPIAISDDKTSVYVLDNIEDDRVGLYELSLAGDNYRKLYTHKNVDITNLVMTADVRSVIAIRIDDGYPSYLLLSNPGDEAKTFKLLLKYFSGSTVSIRSRSRDGRFWVVRTGTDVDPGSYHLYDREAKTIGKLFDSRPDVKAEDLAAMEPIKFESFDGRSIAGYFTPARNASGKVAPLVVLVHGGPHLRDYWGYDATVQALATNGFSVLQINFRGSTGYGYEFESSGYRHWGDEIQKDIIAGTRWAIREQRVDAGNICIMGGSFGAYSAVQSATLAPDLYNCVVANAGIYDLPLMYQKGDIESRYLGDEYLEKTIGRDDDELAKFSPVNRMALLEQPIFIAHGEKDERAPFEHAKRLRKALDQNGKQYEWFVKRREAHGFYDNDNQVEYLQAAIEFLKKHLTVAGNPAGSED